MAFEFLKTEVEGYAFYAAVVVYITIVVIFLNRFLKLIRDKNENPKTVILKKKRIYLLAGLCLITGALIHLGLFYLFFELFPPRQISAVQPRQSYNLSILITFLAFVILFLFGFYLRGNSTMPKQDGPVSGV